MVKNNTNMDRRSLERTELVAKIFEPVSADKKNLLIALSSIYLDGLIAGEAIGAKRAE